MLTQNSGVARIAGLTLAGVGVAHVTSPRLFTPLTRRAFTRRLRLHTFVNGAVATTVGLGISTSRTRSLATVAGVGYGAHLIGRAARTTRRANRAQPPASPPMATLTD